MIPPVMIDLTGGQSRPKSAFYRSSSAPRNRSDEYARRRDTYSPVIRIASAFSSPRSHASSSITPMRQRYMDDEKPKQSVWVAPQRRRQGLAERQEASIFLQHRRAALRQAAASPDSRDDSILSEGKPSSVQALDGKQASTAIFVDEFSTKISTSSTLLAAPSLEVQENESGDAPGEVPAVVCDAPGEIPVVESSLLRKDRHASPLRDTPPMVVGSSLRQDRHASPLQRETPPMVFGSSLRNAPKDPRRQAIIESPPLLRKLRETPKELLFPTSLPSRFRATTIARSQSVDLPRVEQQPVRLVQSSSGLQQQPTVIDVESLWEMKLGTFGASSNVSEAATASKALRTESEAATADKMVVPDILSDVAMASVVSPREESRDPVEDVVPLEVSFSRDGQQETPIDVSDYRQQPETPTTMDPMDVPFEVSFGKKESPIDVTDADYPTETEIIPVKNLELSLHDRSVIQSTSEHHKVDPTKQLEDIIRLKHQRISSPTEIIDVTSERFVEDYEVQENRDVLEPPLEIVTTTSREVTSENAALKELPSKEIIPLEDIPEPDGDNVDELPSKKIIPLEDVPQSDDGDVDKLELQRTSSTDPGVAGQSMYRKAIQRRWKGERRRAIMAMFSNSTEGEKKPEDAEEEVSKDAPPVIPCGLVKCESPPLLKDDLESDRILDLRPTEGADPNIEVVASEPDAEEKIESNVQDNVDKPDPVQEKEVSMAEREVLSKDSSSDEESYAGTGTNGVLDSAKAFLRSLKKDRDITPPSSIKTMPMLSQTSEKSSLVATDAEEEKQEEVAEQKVESEPVQEAHLEPREVLLPAAAETEPVEKSPTRADPPSHDVVPEMEDDWRRSNQVSLFDSTSCGESGVVSNSNGDCTRTVSPTLPETLRVEDPTALSPRQFEAQSSVDDPELEALLNNLSRSRLLKNGETTWRRESFFSGNFASTDVKEASEPVAGTSAPPPGDNVASRSYHDEFTSVLTGAASEAKGKDAIIHLLDDGECQDCVADTTKPNPYSDDLAISDQDTRTSPNEGMYISSSESGTKQQQSLPSYESDGLLESEESKASIAYTGTTSDSDTDSVSLYKGCTVPFVGNLFEKGCELLDIEVKRRKHRNTNSSPSLLYKLKKSKKRLERFRKHSGESESMNPAAQEQTAPVSVSIQDNVVEEGIESDAALFLQDVQTPRSRNVNKSIQDQVFSLANQMVIPEVDNNSLEELKVLWSDSESSQSFLDHYSKEDTNIDADTRSTMLNTPKEIDKDEHGWNQDGAEEGHSVATPFQKRLQERLESIRNVTSPRSEPGAVLVPRYQSNTKSEQVNDDLPPKTIDVHVIRRVESAPFKINNTSGKIVEVISLEEDPRSDEEPQQDSEEENQPVAPVTPMTPSSQKEVTFANVTENDVITLVDEDEPNEAEVEFQQEHLTLQTSKDSKQPDPPQSFIYATSVLSSRGNADPPTQSPLRGTRSSSTPRSMAVSIKVPSNFERSQSVPRVTPVSPESRVRRQRSSPRSSTKVYRCPQTRPQGDKKKKKKSKDRHVVVVEPHQTKEERRLEIEQNHMARVERIRRSRAGGPEILATTKRPDPALNEEERLAALELVEKLSRRAVTLKRRREIKHRRIQEFENAEHQG